MQKAGRRMILFVGTGGQLGALGLIGIFSLIPNQSPGVVW